MIKTCEVCGEKFTTYHKNGRFCCWDHLLEYNSRSKNRRFAAGGVTTKARQIMEKELGRKLRNDEDVHHIDNDPSNDNILNLLVLSREAHERVHGRTKLYMSDAREIRELHRQGYNYTYIKDIYGVSRATIHNVVHNLIWKEEDRKEEVGSTSSSP